MFGRLMLQLPSLHTGGELVVEENQNKTNAQSKQIVDFGQATGKSKFTVHFAAYNADFETELLQVKSGYQLVLVYSLSWLYGTFHFFYFLPKNIF